MSEQSSDTSETTQNTEPVNESTANQQQSQEQPAQASQPAQTADEPTIRIIANGPLVVTGHVPLSEDAVANSDDGSHLVYRHVREYEIPESGEYALCRCGASKNKPFCDGSHEQIHFDGTETADRRTYAERALPYEGPALTLLDDNRCAFLRLCHYNGVDDWNLTEQAEAGTEVEREAIVGSWHCPTGRLEHHDRATGEVYEDSYEPSIIITQDPYEGVSGPFFVRGGVKLIGADGFEYETRNRYSLCRCGASNEKPFCDAEHVNVKFRDDSPAFDGKIGERDESFSESPRGFRHTKPAAAQ